MAVKKFVLKNANITVNSVDLSAWCSKVTITTSFNPVEVTSFGDTYKEYLQGIGDAQIQADFFQDFGSTAVDATLWPLSQSGSVVPVVVKPTSAAISATNPSFTMNSALYDYNPIDGAVGDASTTSATFQCGDQSGLQRGTA